MEFAKAAGTVTDEIISFYLSGESGISLVDVGSYDLNNVKDADSSNIVWFPMPATQVLWYATAVEAIQIGTNSETTKS